MNENKEGMSPKDKNISRRNFLKGAGVAFAAGLVGLFGGKRAEGSSEQNIIPAQENVPVAEGLINIEVPSDFENPEVIFGKDGKRYVFGHQGDDLKVILETGETKLLANTNEYSVGINPGADTSKNPSGLEILISREFGGEKNIFWGENFGTFFRIGRAGHDPRSINLIFNQTETGGTVRSYFAIEKRTDGVEVPYFGSEYLGFEAQARSASIDGDTSLVWFETPIMGFGQLLEVQAVATGKDVNLLLWEKELYKQTTEIQTGWLIHGMKNGSQTDFSSIAFSIGKYEGKSIYNPQMFINSSTHGADTLYSSEGKLLLSISENTVSAVAAAGENVKAARRQKRVELGQQTGQRIGGSGFASVIEGDIPNLYDIEVDNIVNAGDCLFHGAEINGKSTIGYVFKSSKDFSAKLLGLKYNIDLIKETVTFPGELLSFKFGQHNGFFMYQDGEIRKIGKVPLPQITPKAFLPLAAR